MFSQQIALLAAALTGTQGGPGSSDAASLAAEALGGAHQQQPLVPRQQQQQRRVADVSDWQDLEAADTLLAAAAGMQRPSGMHPHQLATQQLLSRQQQQQQLPQLLGRQQQQLPQLLGRQQQLAMQQLPQAPGRQQTAQQRPQQQQLNPQNNAALAAALAGGPVGERDLDEIANQLISTFPEFSDLLNGLSDRLPVLQQQPQPVRGPQPTQLQQALQKQQQPMQRQAHSKQQNLQRLDTTQQQLLDQLIMGVTQHSAADLQMEVQLEQRERLNLLARQEQQTRALRLNHQQQEQQLELEQQEQELLKQLQALKQQKEQQQQQQQFVQLPGQQQLLQALQQQQQQPGLNLNESLNVSQSQASGDHSYGHMGQAAAHTSTRNVATPVAAAAAAAGGGGGGNTPTDSWAGGGTAPRGRTASGKRVKGGSSAAGGSAGLGGTTGLSDPLNMNSALAAALAPPPAALAALASKTPASANLQAQQQQQQGFLQQQQQQSLLSSGNAASPLDMLQGGQLNSTSPAVPGAGRQSTQPSAQVQPVAVKLGSQGDQQQQHQQLGIQRLRNLHHQEHQGRADALLSPQSAASSTPGTNGTQQQQQQQRQQQQQGGLLQQQRQQQPGFQQQQQQHQGLHLRPQQQQQQRRQHQGSDVDDDDQGDDDETDPQLDDLLPPPDMVGMEMPPASTDLMPGGTAAAASMSLRARLGLPPVGLGGPLVAAQAAAGQAGFIRPAVPPNHHAVFVWDFDETLVPLHSLITGRYSQETDSVGQQHAGQLGRQMQALVLQLADDKMHFKQLEDVDVVHVSDVWYLAAQHSQRADRRKRASKRQHGSTAGDGAAGEGGGGTLLSNGLSQQEQQEQQEQQQATDGSGVKDGQPAAKRARVEQQQQDGQATSTSEDLPTASGGSGDMGKLEKGGATAAKANKKAAAAAGGEGVSDAGASKPSGGVFVSGAEGDVQPAELLLRPFKLGPQPDVMKGCWDDIQRVYDAGSGVLPLLLPKPVLRAADQLYEQLDAACSGWLRAAQQLLTELAAREELLVTHVVVGNSQLVPLLAKLLLCKLDTVIGLTEVYSAAAVPKVAAFKRIKAKYGPRARYIVLGDGSEEESSAGLMNWPFVRITLTPQAAAEPAAAGEGDSAAAAGHGAEGGGSQRASRAGDAQGGTDEGGGTQAADHAGGTGGPAGGEAGQQDAAAVCPAVAAAADALGSLGHTIMDLTADKLMQLALSVQEGQ